MRKVFVGVIVGVGLLAGCLETTPKATAPPPSKAPGLVNSSNGELFQPSLSRQFVSPNNLLLDRGITYKKWERSKNTKAYGYEVYQIGSKIVQSDPLLHRIVQSSPNGVVEKFHLKDGDCSGYNASSNDCTTDRERVEILPIQGERRRQRAGEVWYGWSIYIPSDFDDEPNIRKLRILGQLYADGDVNSLFSFVVGDQGYLNLKRVVFEPAYQELDTRLFKVSDIKGRWASFKMHANWAEDGSGWFKVFVDENLEYEFFGRTLYGHPVHPKYGLYRAHLSKDRTASGPMPEQRVFYSNFKVAKTEVGLEP
jgi:hypothetical protein